MLLNMISSNSCAVIIVYYIFSFWYIILFFNIFYNALCIFACYKDFYCERKGNAGKWECQWKFYFVFIYYYCYSPPVSFNKNLGWNQ